MTATPDYVDESLARFKYSFQNGEEFFLNMFPLRTEYVRGLMKEVGFQTVTTYGDFQEHYKDSEPDFFVHVASKKYISTPMAMPPTTKTRRRKMCRPMRIL